MNWKEKFVLFLKGISMGLADIVPGVSGGTIALITEIYERLIFAIKSLDPRIPVRALAGDFEGARRSLKDIDFEFLVPLGLGITLAFLVASRIINTALETYPAFVNSFFFGLILSSAVFVYRRIDSKGVGQALSGILGMISGLTIVSIQKMGLIHSPSMIFVSGFIAICAMILPGISGAFMLFILGQYSFMLGVLEGFDLYFMGIFIAGAAVGLAIFSRVLSHFINNHESTTLAFLTGIMLGALKLPLKEVVLVNEIHRNISFSWNSTNIFLTVISGVMGAVLVLILEERGSG